MLSKFIYLLCAILVFTTISCNTFMPKAPEEDTILDGPIEGLSSSQKLQHLRGDVAFNDQIFTAETGLGPVFVATSCGGCHAADGKGHPSTTLIRFGQTDSTGNQFLEFGGPLLQNRAIPGHTPEILPNTSSITKLLAPAITGLGYLALVPDADIMAMSDPLDLNNDGISGVPNWVELPDYIDPPNSSLKRGSKYIGRFGKKASVYSLLQQTANAYNQDIGITSLFNPIDAFSLKPIEPEIANSTLFDVEFYLKSLKAPIQRDQEDQDVKEGFLIFKKIGCADCHKPQLKTGYSEIEALSNKVFHPYTDLLLHNMGGSLDDNYTEGTAKTYEWRTAPLWGLGLAPGSQGGRYFLLHDGRAASIEEAIMQHGGEAAGRRLNFMQLNETEKSQILKFLKSL
jgi:CxxC motif-containing protein (DUF1111 family)